MCLPVEMIDVGAEWVHLYADENYDPCAEEGDGAGARGLFTGAGADLSATAKCAECGQLFDGPARFVLRELGP